MILLFAVPLYMMLAACTAVVLAVLLPWPSWIRIRAAVLISALISAAENDGFVNNQTRLVAGLRRDLAGASKDLAVAPEMLHLYKSVFSGLNRADDLLKEPNIENFWWGAPLRFRAAVYTDLISIQLTDEAYTSE